MWRAPSARRRAPQKSGARRQRRARRRALARIPAAETKACRRTPAGRICFWTNSVPILALLLEPFRLRFWSSCGSLFGAILDPFLIPHCRRAPAHTKMWHAPVRTGERRRAHRRDPARTDARRFPDAQRCAGMRARQQISAGPGNGPVLRTEQDGTPPSPSAALRRARLRQRHHPDRDLGTMNCAETGGSSRGLVSRSREAS